MLQTIATDAPKLLPSTSAAATPNPGTLAEAQSQTGQQIADAPSLHFTYSPLDRTGLMQGDLIIRTPEVDAILRQVHPHYLNPDYKAFVILTQTCDLVRRDGVNCAARYISLSAVRPLLLVLSRELRSLCDHEWEKVYRITSDKKREKLRQFVERLLNNNEDEYFFLRRDAEGELHEDCCAFLQLSVAVKSDLHYPTLLAAKRLQLNGIFQHKLGYLVGKMYSRVGTPDWVPTHYPQPKQFQHHIEQLIDDDEFAEWLPDDAYRNLEKRARANGDNPVTKELLLGWVEEYLAKQAKRRDEVLKAVHAAFAGMGISEGQIKRGVGRLNSNAVFSSLFK